MDMFRKPLFTFEMANNHQGSVEHGKTIIREMARIIAPYRELFDFAIKFQYRDLDTFIRPDYANRDDIKHVKRFKDTRLTQEQFLELKKEVEDNNIMTMCTPFDEVSAKRVGDQGYDIIKVASCSIGDWPLLEAIAATGLPVIASTAGATLETLDNVVEFFAHRRIQLSLMHCVAEYPTPNDHLEMNQISLLQKRYPKNIIGFSTHENPDDMNPIKIAVAKGARIFERHVGVATDTISLNKYSSTPEGIEAWLANAKDVFEMCGVVDERYVSSEKEKKELQSLQRGVFAKENLAKGMAVDRNKFYFAFPCEEGQLLAGDISKYANISMNSDIDKDKPVYTNDVTITSYRNRVQEIVRNVMKLLKKGNILIPANSSCEISHHYGIDQFEKIGVTIIDCINREYCKKLLIVLPGQDHPMHMHKKKEETFTVLYGTLHVVCDSKELDVKAGESMTVERGMKHKFSSEDGCVFEEVSTTHYKSDSYYDESDGFVDPRKTKVFITQEMLNNFS